MTQSDAPVVKVLTVKQAAEALGCSAAHIYRLLHSGALAAADVSPPGSLRRSNRILVEDLNEFITGSVKRG